MASIEKNIKIIPIDRPFLHVLAQYVFENHKIDAPDFSKILMIFPTQRNKLYFRRYLLDATGTMGIVPPVMKSIDEVIDILYEDAGGERGLVLNSAERNFILKKVIQLLKVEYWKDLPFIKFITIGRRLLHFFDELAKENISFEHLDERIRIGHYPEKFVKDEIVIIKNIYDKYRKALADLGYRDVIDVCKVVGGKKVTLLKLYKQIYIAGLVATTNMENGVIGHMIKDLNAQLILHSSFNAIESAVDPVAYFYLHTKMLNGLGIKEPCTIDTIGKSHSVKPVVHITRTKSVFLQTLHIKEILRSIKHRYQPHRIAIVLTDEKCLHPIIDVLQASGFEYNLSAGLPLFQAPLYSFLKQLLDVVESGFHFAELAVFLKHPLLKNAVINGRSIRPMTYGIREEMIKKRMNYLYFDDHEKSEYLLLINLLKRLRDIVVKQVSWVDYSISLIDLLNEVISYNDDFLKVGAESTNDFCDRLNGLAKLRMVSDITEPGIEMLRFIINILKDDSYKTFGDPMKGIQVIGILEIRNLDFDCIILPSMNEGIFPRRSDKDLFVNQQLRKEVGLPYDKERESLYHFYFTEMINGKKEVFVSFIEEEERDIRSRFIDFQIEKGAIVNEMSKKLSSSSRERKIHSVQKSSDLFKKLIHKLTTRGLSPTNLKNYRECPYRFYLRYLLGVREPDIIVEEADYMEWGRIIHKALCDFYKYDIPDGLIKGDIMRLRSNLHNRLDKAMRRELAQSPKMVNFLDLEIFKKRLDGFLDLEKERSKVGYRVLTDKIEEQISHIISAHNVQVKLYGYPDRIEIEQGKYNILDYKMTIPRKQTYELNDDFVEFQLPLYGLIIAKGDFSLINNLAYYEISRNIRICSLVDPKDINDYLSDFKARILKPTIEEMLSPDVPFCQTCSKTSSKYCAFTDLCGVINA